VSCGKKTSEKRKRNVQNFGVKLLERQLIERQRWSSKSDFKMCFEDAD